MKILFLSLSRFKDYNDSGVYSDLMRAAIDMGHEVFSVLPNNEDDKRYKLIESRGNKILKIHTGQVNGNANFIKKGFNTLLLGGKYKKAIKKFCNERFDLILYSTPPITIYKAIKYAKKKTGAKTCLLLKDIFPQNAVDIGLLSNTGLKGLITSYFRGVEKKYYKISEFIGCMSERNVEYLLDHNGFIEKNKVFVSPNTVDLKDGESDFGCDVDIREKYGIPADARIFVYGGNLGKPQDVPFIIKCLKANANKRDRFFIICGGGSDYSLLDDYIKAKKPNNVLLFAELPSIEYKSIVSKSDVGLIFLDHRFSIPNYPSRLLSYMQFGLPVLSCTDRSTDIGDDIVKGGFGKKCYSDSVESFTEAVDEICALDPDVMSEMGKNSTNYLKEHFSASDAIKKIIQTVGGVECRSEDKHDDR